MRGVRGVDEGGRVMADAGGLRELRVSYVAADVGAGPARLVREIRTAADAGCLLGALLGDAAEERAVVILVDSRFHVLAVSTVAMGGVDSAVVDPRVVFRAALLVNAVGLVFGHNHPSGSTTPSAEDVLLSRRLRQAGDLVGVEVLDSIVVGGPGSWVSLGERGLL